jgi:hypothetical protein
VKYNESGAGTPPVTLTFINKKQAECYCKWIDRQFPNENPITV